MSMSATAVRLSSQMFSNTISMIWTTDIRQMLKRAERFISDSVGSFSRQLDESLTLSDVK